MKNRLSALLLAIVLCVSICGCGEVKDSGDGLSVVTTVFASYDFARQTAGDAASVSMLLPPGSESHSYEPTPQDIIKIEQCDLFVYIGGESEKWVEQILDTVDRSKIKILKLFDYVTPIEETLSEGMQAEEEEESDEVEYDEHIWTSPENAEIMINAICDALCELDGGNETKYRQNADSYCNKIKTLDKDFREVVSNSDKNTLIFADRFPFAYFTREYGLNYFAAFPGCSQETEPAAATVAFLIDKIKSENISTVLYIEFSNERMADTICGETGAKKRLFHSCHNVSADEFESGITYFDLMTQNLEVLREALG